MSAAPSPAKLARVVVIGHSGFIGRRIFSLFAERSPGVELAGASLPQVDLCSPEGAERLRPLFDERTAVIACSAIKKQYGDSLEIFNRNMAMTVNLCRVLETAPVGRLVYLSSGDVYGEDVHNTAITEETRVEPVSYYGAAKYASECLLRKALKAGPGGSLVVLRPPLVYGPGEEGRFYGPSGFAKAAVRGETVTLWGDGSEARSFLYVDDLAGMVHAMTWHGYEGVLNASDGARHTFREVLDALAGILGAPPAVAVRERTKKKVDNVYRNDLLLRLLPGFAFTGLDRGLREVVAAELEGLGPGGPRRGEAR